MQNNELRRLCTSATPGPWYISAPAEQAVWHDKDRRYLIADTSSVFQADGNAEYIAAANPATVLALLDELDRLRTIKDAAENLVKVRGRHHSELAYQQLERALK